MNETTRVHLHPRLAALWEKKPNFLSIPTCDAPSPMAERNALQRFPSDHSLSALARINHLFPDSSVGNRLRSWTAQTQINLWLSKENYNMAQENKIKGSAEREMSLPRAASISPVSPCDWRFYQFSGNKSSLRTISVWV